MVCERWCVKDGVWKMVCDRLCVTKMVCDKDGARKMVCETLCEFTGSGWGLWFSTRKWMLYKLGTQENLATDIKPIWGTLEKWQPPRSAFSKLWIGFFLRKTSPCLNCIMLKLRNQNFWKQLPGNGSMFLEEPALGISLQALRLSKKMVLADPRGSW